MSRKHYIELARTLAELRKDVDPEEFKKVVAKMCSFLLSDNPRFNNKKFVDAVFGR